ncbi:hypothetical protein BD779DRAFT_1438607 [Infundibulicybe gibba]|nr:hypothetical protein BD779DRAFT_1438607 [Infundibulicybe gibba]
MNIPRAYLPPWPFKNMTIFRLMTWASHSAGNGHVTESALTSLARDVVCMPDFRADDLVGFDAHRENQRLDKSEDDPGLKDTPFSNSDKWNETGIDIQIPTGVPQSLPKTFTVPGLHFRSLVEVIKSAFSETTARHFHLTPFRRIHQSHTTAGDETRIFDEMYTSDTWINAHNNLQKQPAEPDCKLERVIAGLMFWSDSTHLTTFGTEKVWPLYLYFGNLSKYLRSKPEFGGCHHVAYIPSIPDRIGEFIASFTGTASRKATLLTHCRRELMHAVWSNLLDDKFLEAYKHGIVLLCPDGIWRRVYPRIFTYSADYPEKVLLAAIRDKGGCPCPRCLVQMSKTDRMGFARDLQSRISGARTYLWDKITTARNLIYNRGYAVASRAVENILQPWSLVPTLNAFAEKLGPLGLDPYAMLVVDLLHEFELGVWKAIFTHIIRVLYAAVPGGGAVTTFNARFRQIPTFGRDTIRRFSNNASEMKRLAARDFEDLLQNMIPVVDGLLPEPHNAQVLRLLFRLAEWHALAKLRIHTEDTLQHLEKTTTTMGREIRAFRDSTRESFTTKELPGEVASRVRRKQKKSEAQTAQNTIITGATTDSNTPTAATGNSTVTPAAQPITQRHKVLNLHTYKFHALGDYARTIRTVGTSDSYSTQTGELAHRTVKRYYQRTNKNNAIRQIAKQERRATRLRRAKEAAQLSERPPNRHSHHPEVSKDDSNITGVELHHYMSSSRDCKQHIMVFPNHPHLNDPAKKDHLLSRLLGHDLDEADDTIYSDAQRNAVRVIDDKIFSVKLLRINYTTYDMRRDQDVINPRTHPDVMMISPETGPTAHPFWYARVLGIFHANVLHTGPESRNRSVQHMEFLWVRWFGIEPNYQWGFRVARLPKIGFVPETDPDAFGFLDPSLVLRACHLAPMFAAGRTSNLLQTTAPTAARPLSETDDWMNYYVMMFVDRDMFMRYRGGGIGHVMHNRQQPPDLDQVEESDDIDMAVFGDEEPAVNTDDLADPDSDDDSVGNPEDSELETDDESGDSDSESDGDGDSVDDYGFSGL